MESLIAKRNEYSKNCSKTLVASAPSKTGNYCKGEFDMFVCWPHSHSGNVSIPCPSFLPWIGEDTSRRAHRECLENGSWRPMENSSEAWRDVSECWEHHYFKDKEDEILRQTALRLISVIGYSLSLVSLTLATLLMGVLRKLHCTRNYIHMNLFVSFILRAVAIISKEIIMHLMYSNLPKDDPGWNAYSSSTVHSLSKVCMEYFVACNYFWLLVEAVFLHTLLFTAVLTKRCLLKKYMLLGWGESQISYLSTLVLIPLLGIHEVVFTVLIDECVEGSSRYARNFVNLTLSSFQGFLVAVLYCFANGEVQAELKKRWQLFLFTNHFKVRTCFQGVPLKHLWKCTRGRHPRCSRQSDSYDEGGTSATHPHLLRVAVHGRGREIGEIKGQALNGYDVTGLEFLTRKSLSSSDGEMTLGETMEEILEESEF
uniref:Glucagon like peptide 2 receptor n=1 Tax=Amphilophus citrinellus TaxID=61819 RepID=A0A3Q0QVR7_AMPCI